MTLKDCTERQIVTCPFADDGTLHAFRWRVAVTISGQGEPTHFAYASGDAYPSLNRWQTLIYNHEQQPLRSEDVLADDGQLNPALAWSPVRRRGRYRQLRSRSG